MDHLQPILGYALISATVGVILRAIAERNKIIGQIVSSILGAVWGIVTYLVVPVLVTEDVGPVDAIKRSGSLLKKTWGEQIIGNFSIGAVFGLLILGAIIGLGIPLALLIAATGSVIVAILGGVLIVLVVVGLSLLSSALGGIYTAALYRYAVEGQVSAQFSPELIQGAFKAKRG
jgi:hypothetical protein